MRPAARGRRRAAFLHPGPAKVRRTVSRSRCIHGGSCEESIMSEQSASRWTLVATSFGLGMALLDVTAVNVAVPAVQTSLQTNVRGLSWIIDGYTLAFASLLLLAGGLGDRLGARRVFVAGLSIFT